MDKELAALEDWAVEQILEWKDTLELKQKSSGKTPSDLKRALRFGNELVFNPEAYGDMLEKARSEGKSAKEIIQEIRKVETKLLDTKKVLLSDWVHHRTAQRTGGNTFLYMKGDSRRAARNILRGEGLFLGNVDENLVSLPGVLHTKKTQGLEKVWYDSLSFDEQRGLYLPTEEGGSGLRLAHETGATAGVISGTAPNAGELSPEEGAGFMKKSITQQQAETARAVQQRGTTGFEQAVREEVGDPSIYTPEGPTKVVLTPENSPRIFGTFKNGSFRLSFGLDKAVDTIKRNISGAVAGAATVIEPEAVKAALQGDYTEAAKQTFVGAGFGALAEQGIKRAAPVVARTAASALPKAAVSMIGGAAKFVPVLAGGYAGYQMLDAIVEGATGKDLQETGVAAEEKKEELREQGYSEYELRRRARTGYRKP